MSFSRSCLAIGKNTYVFTAYGRLNEGLDLFENVLLGLGSVENLVKVVYFISELQSTRVERANLCIIKNAGLDPAEDPHCAFELNQLVELGLSNQLVVVQ